jgi:hypothetical protein
MKFHTYILILVISLLAVPAFAQVTTSAPAIEAIRSQIDGEQIDHGQIEIKTGVNRRIKSSPSGIIDVEILPGGVLNQELLTLYVRKLALTEAIDSVVIDDEIVKMDIYGQARLLRIIPIKLLHEVVVTIEGASIDVVVENKTSWSWLAQHPTPETVAGDIRTHVEQSKFISVSQLKAYILEGIVGSVTK